MAPSQNPPPQSPASKPVVANNAIYVSPDGDDANPGTLDKPVRTVQAAKEAVAYHLKSAGKQTGDIYVYLRGGTYMTPYTLAYGPEDSGRDGYKIIYTSYKNETALITSGIVLTGWQSADSEFKGVAGVYKTKLPEGANDIYCLYEDDRRAWPARNPNLIDGYPSYLELAGSTNAKLLRAVAKRADIKQADYSYAQLVVWPGSHSGGTMQFNWYSSVDPILNYDQETGSMKLAEYTWWDMTVGNRYYIQNVKEFIDAPGEFFYNPDTRDVYYKPYGDINKVIIQAPSQINNVFLCGKPGTPVRNIVFENLSFANSNFAKSFSYGGDAETTEGMVKLEYTENITIRGCHIYNSGFHGVAMYDWNQKNTVRDCLIENTGIGGVYIGGHNYITGTIKSPIDGCVSRNNTVENCIIRRAGQTSPGHGYGVFLNTSGYNKVTRNTIYDIPKGAINLYNTQNGYMVGTKIGNLAVTDENCDDFKYCRDNEISFNEIFAVMKDGADCGAIITYGVGGQNVIKNNYIHDNPSLKDGLNMGIYLDDNSDGVLIRDNIVTRIGGSYWVFGAMLKGRNITLTNNIFYNTGANQGVVSTMITRVAAWGMPQERTHGFVNTNNIIFETRSAVYLYYHWGFNYQYNTILRQDNNVYSIKRNLNENIIGFSTFGSAIDGSGDQWFSKSYYDYAAEGPYDQNSIWADPQFTDPDNGDFTLKTGSPALKLGFEQISLTGVGVNKSAFPFKGAISQMEKAAAFRHTW